MYIINVFQKRPLGESNFTETDLSKGTKPVKNNRRMSVGLEQRKKRRRYVNL